LIGSIWIFVAINFTSYFGSNIITNEKMEHSIIALFFLLSLNIEMEGPDIASYVAIAVSAATAIYGIVNHKRIRSNCFGRKLEVSLDIEATTPPNTQPALSNIVVDNK